MTPPNEILRALDLDAVRAEIRSIELPEWDYLEVADLVARAALQYLASDLTADSMEVEWEFDRELKGVFDLVLTRGRSIQIVDWKTTGTVERPGYSDELEGDWQTDFYMTRGVESLAQQYSEYDLAGMEYRVFDHEKRHRRIVVPPPKDPAGLNKSVTTQLIMVEQMYEALTDNPLGQWPRRRPRACGRGGDRCAFYRDCREGHYVPHPDADFPSLRPRSKSSIDDFLDCPEYWRRTRLCGETGESTTQMNFGTSFHRGVASVWEQAWKRRAEFL